MLGCMTIKWRMTWQQKFVSLRSQFHRFMPFRRPLGYTKYLSWSAPSVHNWCVGNNTDLSLQRKSGKFYKTAMARFRRGHILCMKFIQRMKIFSCCIRSLPASPARLFDCIRVPLKTTVGWPGWGLWHSFAARYFGWDVGFSAPTGLATTTLLELLLFKKHIKHPNICKVPMNYNVICIIVVVNCVFVKKLYFYASIVLLY